MSRQLVVKALYVRNIFLYTRQWNIYASHSENLRAETLSGGSQPPKPEIKQSGENSFCPCLCEQVCVICSFCQSPGMWCGFRISCLCNVPKCRACSWPIFASLWEPTSQTNFFYKFPEGVLLCPPFSASCKNSLFFSVMWAPCVMHAVVVFCPNLFLAVIFMTLALMAPTFCLFSRLPLKYLVIIHQTSCVESCLTQLCQFLRTGPYTVQGKVKLHISVWTKYHRRLMSNVLMYHEEVLIAETWLMEKGLCASWGSGCLLCKMPWQYSTRYDTVQTGCSFATFCIRHQKRISRSIAMKPGSWPSKMVDRIPFDLSLWLALHSTW